MSCSSGSQFIHVFRTLNRKAIEAKLKCSSSGAGGQDAAANPVQIQFVKIGHSCSYTHNDRANTNGSAGAAADVGSKGNLHRDVSTSHLHAGVMAHFTHLRDIVPGELGDVLAAEEKSAREDGDRSVRWLDIRGYHPGVLALVSNFYLLPHEMLVGEELELPAAAHADFYTRAPEGGHHSESRSTSAKNESAAEHSTSHVKRMHSDPTTGTYASAPAAQREEATVTPASGQGDEAGPAHSKEVAAAASSTAPFSPAPSFESGSKPHQEHHLPLKRSDAFLSSSFSTIPGGRLHSPPSSSNSTMKLLIHSLRLDHFPLQPVADSDGKDPAGNARLKLVSFREYKARKVGITRIPIHLVLVNDYTLISVRPWQVDEGEGDVQMGSGAAAAAAAKAKAAQEAAVAAAAKASSSTTDRDKDVSADAEAEEDLFSDFIASLDNTDATSLDSVFGLTSAKILLLKLWSVFWRERSQRE